MGFSDPTSGLPHRTPLGWLDELRELTLDAVDQLCLNREVPYVLIGSTLALAAGEGEDRLEPDEGTVELAVRTADVARLTAGAGAFLRARGLTFEATDGGTFVASPLAARRTTDGCWRPSAVMYPVTLDSDRWVPDFALRRHTPGLELPADVFATARRGRVGAVPVSLPAPELTPALRALMAHGPSRAGTDAAGGAPRTLPADLPGLPVARAGLQVRPIRDGLLVCTANPPQVHRLNTSAALIFELANGQRRPAQIAVELSAGFGLPEPPVASVVACVERLCAEGVLEIA